MSEVKLITRFGVKEFLLRQIGKDITWVLYPSVAWGSTHLLESYGLISPNQRPTRAGTWAWVVLQSPLFFASGKKTSFLRTEMFTLSKIFG